MVRIQLIPDKVCLSHFHLGQSLYAAVEAVRLHLPHHRAQLLNDPSFPNSSPIYLRVFGSHNEVFTLTFDPEFQSLTSLSYLVPDNEKGVAIALEIVQVGVEGELYFPVSASDVTAVCGEPFGCHSDESSNVMLVYHQMHFVFKQLDHTSQLVKIEMGESRLSSPSHLGHPLSRGSQLQMNFIVDRLTGSVNGLALLERSPYKRGTKECEDDFIATVRFGDHFEDIVSKLGTPSGVYYKDDHHPSHIGSALENSSLSHQVSLSYSRLGIDVILDAQRGTVTKLVLHSNIPDHYQFCSYARCFFRFSVTPLGLATSDECRDGLLITPTTSWQVLELYVNPKCFGRIGSLHCSPSTNCFYPFPISSLHHLFQQVIVEATTNDDIATLTLLSPDCQPHSCGLLDYKLLRSGDSEQREVCVMRNIPSISQQSSDEEEFFDCEENTFHSAPTSVMSDIRQGLVDKVPGKKDFNSGKAPPISTGVSLECGKSECKSITMKRTALFGPNVNVLTQSVIPRGQSLKNHAGESVLYEFLEDGDGHMTGKSSEDIVHGSESVIISLFHEAPGDVLREHGSNHEDVFEPNSFDFISDLEIMSASSEDKETDCDRFTQPSTTLIEEPEFVYQPKSNADIKANNFITSSRTLHFTKPVSSRREKRKHMMAHTTSSQQRVREKYTESTDIQNSGTGDQSQIPSQFDLVESTGRDAGPIESTGRDAGPIESTGRDAGPVESTGIDTGPIESTGRDAVPIESTGRDAGPIESTGRDACPIESTGIDAGPVESTGRDAGPVESTGRDAGPMESTGRDAGPIESTGRDAGPIESTGIDASPIESTGRDAGPVESTGRDAGPVESTGRDAGPMESTGRDAGPVESTGRDAGPLECTGKEPIQREHPENSDFVFLPLISDDVECILEGATTRRQWTGDEFTPESGPPSMTPERVLEELIICEHEEVCDILKQRNMDLLAIREAVSKEAKPSNLCELSGDVTVPISLIRTISESDGWTLSMSANMLPWIHELLIPESDTRYRRLLTEALLNILSNHTLLILRHQLGRARSLSQLERIQCTICYMTLEKIDQSVDNLIARLVEEEIDRDNKECDEELLGRLRDAKGHLRKLFRKLEVQ